MILDGERRSRRTFKGHSSAMAQVYNHIILPLANRRDRVTQIRWGIADYEQHYGAAPEGMWLSETAADTESLGAELARTARHGVVIALNGDLGAGKTQWVRGFAKGLGITARVHSPTFTLVNEYAGGRLRLFHLDLYRLESPAQILAAGIDEYLSPDGVAVIEWAQRVFDQQSRPPGLITVSFEIIDSDERKIIYDAPGA